MCVRGGQGSHFSSAAYAAAVLPVPSRASVLVSPRPLPLTAQHFVGPRGKLGTGTHLATKTHPQNGGVGRLSSLLSFP